jgi:hypothetical protein
MDEKDSKRLNTGLGILGDDFLMFGHLLLSRDTTSAKYDRIAYAVSVYVNGTGVTLATIVLDEDTYDVSIGSRDNRFVVYPWQLLGGRKDVAKRDYCVRGNELMGVLLDLETRYNLCQNNVSEYDIDDSAIRAANLREAKKMR